MNIFKTPPEDSKQWQADSPGLKAMRIIKPIAAVMSAVSLGGGIASFFGLGFGTTSGIILITAFAVFAYFFDNTAVTSGESVVREFILSIDKQIEKNTLFWISVASSAIICLSMVFGSFMMSKNGISYLISEYRSTIAVQIQTDTTTDNTIDELKQGNASAIEMEKSVYDAKVAAINAKYDGQISGLNAEIERREKQRNKDNTQYIDQKQDQVRKQIGEAEAKRGDELLTASNEFQAKQSEILKEQGKLSALQLEKSKKEGERLEQDIADKNELDKELSYLVSSIFSWSVVLMLFIGLKLTMLETRNGILPNPVLSNADLSGQTTLFRLILSVPNFAISCLTWVSEQLYLYAPKKPTPVVDNELIDYKAAQVSTTAITKPDNTGMSRKKVLKAVKKSNRTNKPEDRLTAWDVISAYLQTHDTSEIKTFYDSCVSFIENKGPNPFHARTIISGFSTISARKSFVNDDRYNERSTHGFSENSHANRVLPGQKVCVNPACGKVFTPNSSKQKYCEDNCRYEYHRTKGEHSKTYPDRF